MMKYRNEIYLRGTIVHVAQSPKTHIYTLAVHMNGKSRGSSYPIVFVKKDVGFPEFQKGESVTVMGHLSSTKMDKGNKKEYVKSIFVDDISRSERHLVQQGVACLDKFAGGLGDDINTYLFAGQISHIYDIDQDRRIYTLLIKNNAGGRENFAYADVICYSKGIEALAGAKEGDWLIAAGYIYSKYYPKKQKTLASFIAKDVELILADA